MRETNGLNYFAKMLLDHDELQWEQDETRERLAWWRLGSAHEVGWCGEHVGPFENFGWDVYDSGSAALAVRNTTAAGVPLGISKLRDTTHRYLGIDNQGRVLEVVAGERLRKADGTVLTVPADSTWYTLVGRYATRRLEPGKLTLTGGSVTVTGTGTQFTRYGQGTDPKSTLIRIDATDSSNGNEGTYEIDTITDDLNMTLVSAPPNSESSVTFRVKGRFRGGEPADVDIHNCAHIEWELVARTTTRPADGALVAYDVRNVAGTLTFIDRRRSNIFRPIDGTIRSYGLLCDDSYLTYTTSPTSELTTTETISFVSSVADSDVGIVGISLAPVASGSHTTTLATDQATGMMLATLFDDGTTRTIRVHHDTVVSSGNGGADYDDPDNGATIDVVSAAGIRDVALVALPVASGNTHAVFYVDSTGNVIQRTTTDNGANWSAPTTIWNPGGAEEVSRIAAVLTRMGRVLIVGTYSTGNRLRYVFSDDLCTTWDNNSQAGYGYSGSGASTDVALCEDDRGNLWTASVEGARVELYRGQAEGNPAPSATEQSAGWPVGPEQNVDYVDVFALPNGTIGIVTGCENFVGNRSVHLFVVARRNILHKQTLVSSPNPSDADYAVPVAVGVAASGHVHLATGVKFDSLGNYSADVKVSRWSPVAIERAWTWYGGQ